MKTKILIAVLGLIIYIGTWIYIFSNTENQSAEDVVPVKLQQPEFFLYDIPNDTLVYQACIYYDIHHPEIVVAQSILETGFYRSKGCLNDKNLFGLYNGNKNQFFKFNHWTESVKAYKDMIQYKYKNNEDYYYFLNRIGYAEDSLYNNKLKNIVKIYGLSEIYTKK